MRILKYLLGLMFVVTSTFEVTAQQTPVFTQVRENNVVVNPASVSRDYIFYRNPWSVGASHRSQWVDIEGAPTTQSLRVNYVLEDQNLDIGGYIINDVTGAIGYTGTYVKGAYHLAFDDYNDSKLALGLSAGVVQYRLKYSELYFQGADEISDNQVNKKLFPDVGIGAYFFNEKYYAGISVPQTFGLSVSHDDILTDTELTVARIQHIYASGGAYILVNDAKSTYIEPNVWVKYVSGAPVNVDISARFRHNETFFVGAGYQTSKSGHFEAGIILNYDNVGLDGNLQIGYGYGKYFAEYGPSFGASHEVNLVYSFGY